MPENSEGLNPSEASNQKTSWKERIGILFKRKRDSIIPPTSQADFSNSTNTEIVPSDLRQEYEARKTEIEALYSQTAYWHGTGRKQYRNGETVNVLDGVLNNGGLAPQRDPFNTKTGITQTLSLSDRRMYAGGYAKMHLTKDISLEYEYKSGEFWGIFLRNTIREAMGDTKLEGAIKAGKVLWSHLKEGRSPAYLLSVAKNARSWSAKVTREEYKKPMDKVFTVRSDIPENYPILIGIKEGQFAPAKVAEFIALYEARSAIRIPFSGFTHIEVPKANIQETEQFLAQKEITNIPVIPMELGEIYSSQFSPKQLIDGNPFRK